MDWQKVKKVYMIGIKGVGMTMLAEFLSSQKIIVEGSDTGESFMTDTVLAKAGIKVYAGFKAEQVSHEADLIIYSTAYNTDNNVEVATAVTEGLQILTYAEAMAKVFNYRHGIAVCGSHGKTTTTAWLGYTMDKLNMRPSVMVGARVPQFDGAGLTGQSDYLVIEADEYQNKLKNFEPKAVLLNNIDYDHPDFFLDEAAYRQVFVDFVAKIPSKGFLVANFDDEQVRAVAQNCSAKIISYAIDNEADYRASEIAVQSGEQYFKVTCGADDFGVFVIKMPGRHNILNALAVIATCIELGADLFALRDALRGFTGTARRLELRGDYHGAKLYDDYAHHPTEVKATIEAVKSLYPDKHFILLFHPHTFTRTKALLDDFAQSLLGADELAIIEIYGSAREEHGGVSSHDLIAKIKNLDSEKSVEYLADLQAAEDFVSRKASAGRIIVLMGAGDVFRVADKLLSEE